MKTAECKESNFIPLIEIQAMKSLHNKLKKKSKSSKKPLGFNINPSRRQKKIKKNLKKRRKSLERKRRSRREERSTWLTPQGC